jgi:hypothetical protein
MTYISPLSIYSVELEEKSRVTRFENGQPIWETYTQFNISLDGKMIGFVFDEDQIESYIDEFENGSRINPIYFTGLTAG